MKFCSRITLNDQRGKLLIKVIGIKAVQTFLSTTMEKNLTLKTSVSSKDWVIQGTLV